MKTPLSSIFLFISSFFLAQDQVKETVGDVSNNVSDALDKATDFISPTIILTIIVVLILIWGSIKTVDWLFDKLVNKFNRHRLKILRAQPVINILIWIIGINALIFTLFEPTAEKVYAGLASLSIALGFALQDILKNIFGGILIILDKPFQIGDRINIKGNYGEVVNIGLRNTQINTLDDNLVTIPNSTIISDNISNANAGALDCMVVVNLWLPININVEQVRKIAYEAAATSRFLNLDKPITILFFDHFHSNPSTNVKIKAYVLDTRYEKGFEGDVTEASKKAFRQAGIYDIKND